MFIIWNHIKSNRRFCCGNVNIAYTFVIRHGRKSVSSRSWNLSHLEDLAKSRKGTCKWFMSDFRPTPEWFVSDLRPLPGVLWVRKTDTRFSINNPSRDETMGLCIHLIMQSFGPMETFSALLALCAGNSRVTGEFPSQRTVTWSFDVFFNLHLNN